ncbi:MAG: hypothetical protein M5R42_04415 [Rhodocyclaceae bacterium]|nr:hypothetical protein [Rhodocyclaceae bacterium]
MLTGVPAGEPDAQGMVPQGTINHRVATQPAELSALRQTHAAAGRKRAWREESRGIAQASRIRQWSCFPKLFCNRFQLNLQAGNVMQRLR